MGNYIALLHKEAESDFGVSFPDFPGCVTAGVDLEDARQMAAEAPQLHIEGMIEDGDPIPAPSSLDEIVEQSIAADAVVLVVTVDEKAPKVVRVNVTFTEDVLREIDDYVERQGMSRSAFLAQAAQLQIRPTE